MNAVIDSRFNVVVNRVSGGGVLLFISTTDRHSLKTAPYEGVDGTHVVLVGDVKDALIGLINEYGNEGLNEKIPGGISPTTLTKLRKHLGIAHSPGRGGYRGKK